jgi:signal transduction histidine kinase/ActR/RegA family two-component response regulator/PAS domain-containing protein
VTLAVALAVVLATCWLLYQREAGQIAHSQTEREITRVNLLGKLMQSELRPITDDLRLLADGDGLRRYLAMGDPAGLAAALHRATFFSEHKPFYDQIRYIDEQGNEVIRVNAGGRVAPASQLQNQAASAYFRKTMQLPDGGLYVSKFDLDVEDGKVERPPRPIVRFAVPVSDPQGRRRGIYVINYLGSGIINRLQELIPLFSHRLRMLNAEGYWLKGARPGEEWGFMIPERAHFTLARTNPERWKQILENPTGQIQTDGGVFTWQTLTPAEYTELDTKDLDAGDRFLVMASEVSASEWSALFSGLRQIMLIVTAALVLLTMASVWLFSRWRSTMRTLRVANDQLEQRVKERTSELEASNELLRDREQLLEETGSLAKVGGWDHDPITGEGRWTPEVAHIHELDPSIETNQQFGLQFYPGKSRTQLEAALNKSATDGTPYDLELEFLTARGAHRWVRTICRPTVKDGKVVRLRGALQDVTERKQAELKLRAQLQRLHLLEQITRSIGERQDLPSILQVTTGALEEEMPLDFACVGLYQPAQRSLTVAAVGAASAELATRLGMSPKSVVPIDENGLSRSVRGHLVYEPDITAISHPFPQRLAAAGLRALVIAPLQIESQVFGVLVAARLQAGSFSSGECEFLRQLSEHVALAAHQAQLHGALQTAYVDLTNTQQAIIQQERLKVLGQMASGIAHDINNSISPIMLYTDSLLEREPDLSERTRASLRTIQQAVSDVAETVARMREFYRQRDSQQDLGAVPINELVQQVTELTRARWQAMPQQRGIVIDLRTELSAALPLVMGIESEIREALTNLVFNAVDAMPQGGTLTLRSRPGEAGEVIVEVVDDGAGMDEETRRRCLEPFYTTKGERGTGLGLAMVYGVMQRHNGGIELDSSPGLGTTVRLRFKVAEGKSFTASEDKVPPKGLKLLLIDDDPIVLKSLREILELDGHDILTASGGQQGIDTFRASRRDGEKPVSAVVTDLGMPHVDGRTVANAIKQESAATPVIMLTGWGERLLAEGIAPVNVDRVLSKPPRIKEIREALADLVKLGRQR